MKMGLCLNPWKEYIISTVIKLGVCILILALSWLLDYLRWNCERKSFMKGLRKGFFWFAGLASIFFTCCCISFFLNTLLFFWIGFLLCLIYNMFWNYMSGDNKDIEGHIKLGVFFFVILLNQILSGNAETKR